MSIEYRKLGNTGTIVTKFCLGTMTFGAESDEATSHKLLDDYAKSGGNFIDTADVYSTGVSETIIGKWLKGHPTRNKQSCRRRSRRREIAGSLRWESARPRRRLLELSRLARHEGVRVRQGARLGGTGDAATAIQSARARDRIRNRAGLH
jgi:hypothetical protein